MQIGSEKWLDLLRQGAAELACDLPPEACAAFTSYAQQLLVWSRKINLTAIKDPHDIAVKHFLDSLAPAPLIPPGACLLDIGAGAGFPGLPIKILRPDVAVSLVDASRKKVSFMQQIIRRLALENTAAFHIRAETLAAMDSTKRPSRTRLQNLNRHTDQSGPSLPVHFDVIIARALTSLKAFMGLARPLLAENGRMIALKGPLAEAELAQARAFLRSNAIASDQSPDRWEVSVAHYHLPFTKDRRCLVSIYRN